VASRSSNYKRGGKQAGDKLFLLLLGSVPARAPTKLLREAKENEDGEDGVFEEERRSKSSSSNPKRDTCCVKPAWYHRRTKKGMNRKGDYGNGGRSKS